jgi:branched-chain amino acid transport system permease protein
MLLDILFAGLTTGAIYALMATSLNVAYRPTTVFNLAHGLFFTIGGMTAATLAGRGWNWFAAALVALAVVAVVAAVCWFTAIMPVLRFPAGNAMWIISTLAFELVGDNVNGKIWTDEPRSLPAPLGLSTDNLGGHAISTYGIAVIVLVLLIVGALELAYRSAQGRAVLAVFEDRDAAMLRGINVTALSAGSVIAGGVLAGLAGVLAAPLLFASLGSAFPILISAFAAAVVGGLGSLRGALIGGFVVALGENVAIQVVNPGYQLVATFLIVMVVLLARPRGLFGGAVVRQI